MKDQGIFSLVIILLILITLSPENVWVMLGEISCWSLLGLKRVKTSRAKIRRVRLGKGALSPAPARFSHFLFTPFY